jgi:hypothetical protein
MSVPCDTSRSGCLDLLSEKRGYKIRRGVPIVLQISGAGYCVPVTRQAAGRPVGSKTARADGLDQAVTSRRATLTILAQPTRGPRVEGKVSGRVLAVLLGHICERRPVTRYRAAMQGTCNTAPTGASTGEMQKELA